MGYAYNIIISAFFTLFSYLFDRTVCGHRLTIGRLTLSAAHDIRYQATINDTYTFHFNAASFTWRFHLPYADDFRWCTIAFNSVYYTSSTGDVSTAHFEIILLFFPVFFRQTSGPWTNITVDDLRIKVYKSAETPYFIQQLRQNLVATILTGEVLRSDIVRTSFRFGGLLERPLERSDDYAESSDDSDSETLACENDVDVHNAEVYGERCAKPLRTYDDEEMAYDFVIRQLHINNREGRIYTFGSIDSQVRRDWTHDRGSLVMVAKECRWVHVHFPFERVAPRSRFTQLCSSLFHFPSDLVRMVRAPISGVNVYVSRLDVTFESFRLRDAELLKKGFVLAREKSISSGISWSDVLFDALTHAFSSS